MVTALDSQNLGLLKIRERIHACVKTRLQINALNKEAIRRLLSYFALPMNTPLAAHLAWRSCSVMWYASGDRSADWNHYTKRGLLVSVYSTTLLYWMSDEGNNEGDFPETWAFLDRRISDVLKTFAVPYQLESMLSRFTGPFLSRTVFRS
jgi:ubiquinone biosynthesis protein COQ9